MPRYSSDESKNPLGTYRFSMLVHGFTVDDDPNGGQAEPDKSAFTSYAVGPLLRRASVGGTVALVAAIILAIVTAVVLFG